MPKHLLALLLATSALSGFALMGCRHAQAPFSPTADCPKLTYCGQCASRGECAWCGNPGDSSHGQCVAIAQAKCEAPLEWAQTPDHCPPPPSEKEPGSTATSSTSAPSGNPETAAEDNRVHAPAARPLGAQQRESLRRSLQRAFPSSTVTDAMVDAAQVVLGRWQHAPADRMGPASVAPDQGTSDPASARVDHAPIVRPVRAREHKLYLGYADHHRVRSAPPAARAMQSEFVMPLPMVRVTLPDQLDASHRTISTEIGDVDLSVDHLLGSVELVASKYGGDKYLGYRPARVDLVTPARDANWRFGAIALYLGYKNAGDRAPSFYMLEAGTATGDAKMIYFSPDMKPIEHATSYYLPTAFVTMSNTYSGVLTMGASPNEDEPSELEIRSFAPGAAEPYITVTLDYKRKDEFMLPLPIEITLDAGLRIALIARALNVPSGEPLEALLADLAQRLNWIHKPALAPSPTTATPTTP